MLNIERLRMQLPAGFEHRASTIASLVAEAMADFHPTDELTMEKLSIGPVRISQNATDQEIAHVVVEQIDSKIRDKS
jgi:hypothetical protein